jgi:proteasomal ATPase-associated factor 1
MGIEGSAPTALVQVTVQADWTDVISEALRLNSTGTFWVSCYKRGTVFCQVQLPSRMKREENRQ